MIMGSSYERLPGSAGRRAAAWVAPVLGLAILVAASVFDVDDVVARWFAAAPPSAAAPPTLAVRREDRSDYVGADSLYPWPHVAEPHRATVLELDGAAATAWAVEGERPNGGSDATRALHTFSRTGRHGVRVGAGGDSHDFTVMVKYVRREIRALGDADREGFLGALHVVYHASDADGRRRYGPKFRSSTYLVKKHLYGAADRSCDHWHDDAGILNHHVAFTLELEQSLQAIDARVAVPYVLEEIEVALGRDAEDEDPEERGRPPRARAAPQERQRGRRERQDRDGVEADLRRGPPLVRRGDVVEGRALGDDVGHDGEDARERDEAAVALAPQRDGDPQRPAQLADAGEAAVHEDAVERAVVPGVALQVEGGEDGAPGALPDPGDGEVFHPTGVGVVGPDLGEEDDLPSDGDDFSLFSHPKSLENRHGHRTLATTLSASCQSTVSLSSSRGSMGILIVRDRSAWAASDWLL